MSVTRYLNKEGMGEGITPSLLIGVVFGLVDQLLQDLAVAQSNQIPLWF